MAPLRLPARVQDWLTGYSLSGARLTIDTETVHMAPLRLRPKSAWVGHFPFAFWVEKEVREHFAALGAALKA